MCVCLFAAGERRSRRARKNRQPVKACSTDTLAMLKLRVFEVLSVHPANQRLYVRGQLLEGDDCTLAKVGLLGCVYVGQARASCAWGVGCCVSERQWH